MTKWTRNGGDFFGADKPLSAGPLIEIVRGNAVHLMTECLTDITTPIVGPADSGIVITGAGTWEAIWKRVRPFPVPIRHNIDGSLASIKCTLHIYHDGSAGGTLRMYLSKHPPGQYTTARSRQWSASTGLLGAHFENYVDESLPTPGAGQTTIALQLQVTDDVINQYYCSNSAVEASGKRGPAVTWVTFDLRIAATHLTHLKALRVQDVLS